MFFLCASILLKYGTVLDAEWLLASILEVVVLQCQIMELNALGFFERKKELHKYHLFLIQYLHSLWILLLLISWWTLSSWNVGRCILIWFICSGLQQLHIRTGNKSTQEVTPVRGRKEMTCCVSAVTSLRLYIIRLMPHSDRTKLNFPYRLKNWSCSSCALELVIISISLLVSES